MKQYLKAIFESYPELFFLRGYKKGIIIFLMTFSNYNVGLAGLLCVTAVYIFARLINFDKEYLNSGFYTYNPLLVGFSIGYIFEITPLSIFFIISAGILSFILTIMLSNIFYFFFRLPILSLPFVFVSLISSIASLRYSNLFVNSIYVHDFSNYDMYFPLWLSGFLKSMGGIIFSPNIPVGIVISLLVFFSSRIIFMLAITGYYVGTILSGILSGSMDNAFMDMSNFNFILISIAIGGVFLIPSKRNYILAFIAVVSSTIFLDAVKVIASYYTAPVFTLPFNIITLSFIYVLGLINYNSITQNIKDTPEENLDYYLSNLVRFKGELKTIFLPFSGEWKVWQGFDGDWTHKGAWKYAFDFIIVDEKGNSFKEDGTNIEDYYAFKKTVLSPVRGIVTTIINDQNDNSIGDANKINNWGNLVLIYDYRGFYIEISHLCKDSIVVKECDWVEIGSFLALCGNSGYSPQPHIHIQVQYLPQIGSYTVPFSFVSYNSELTFYSNNIPCEGQKVEPIYTDKALSIKMNYLIDNEFKYEVFFNDKRIDEMNLKVKMAFDGTYYFETEDGKLYFGIFNGTFYFYSVEGKDQYLRLLFSALPRLPLTYKENLTWNDSVPVGLVSEGVKKAFLQFIHSFNHDMAHASCNYTFVSKNKIEGKISGSLIRKPILTEVELDEFIGIKSFKSGKYSFKKVEA
ncbi:MAG: urea transporter [Cyanobacteriota bacterium]